jgi:hypothetical protein
MRGAIPPLPPICLRGVVLSSAQGQLYLYLYSVGDVILCVPQDPPHCCAYHETSYCGSNVVVSVFSCNLATSSVCVPVTLSSYSNGHFSDKIWRCSLHLWTRAAVGGLRDVQKKIGEFSSMCTGILEKGVHPPTEKLTSTTMSCQFGG